MNIYEVLDNLNIEFEEVKHVPLYTIEDALRLDITSIIDGVECKNLFLKGNNGYYLVFMECSKEANLKYLQEYLNEKKLSFAKEEDLKRILGLEKGSVTPLGIINDRSNKTYLLLDKELREEKVLVHPLVNDKTISIEFKDLVKFINYCGNYYEVIKM